MLGLAVLFFLGLWVVLTLLATWLGAKLGRKLLPTKGGAIGGLLGFMLLMGGWIVYWIGEYIYIQHTVSHLCETEGGITVYVTPEEWRQQIGEEEWTKSFYTGNPDENYPKNSTMIFKGRTYHIFGQLNQRVFMYVVNGGGNKGDIYINDRIYYDFKFNRVLYHQRVYSASGSPPLHNSLEAFKFWLDYGIHNCGMEDKLLDHYQYSSQKRSN